MANTQWMYSQGVLQEPLDLIKAELGANEPLAFSLKKSTPTNLGQPKGDAEIAICGGGLHVS